MVFRIASVLIVAFWLVMTGLLVQLTYFPEESRLAEVDPEYVVGLFLRNEELSELRVFKDGKPVGDLKMQAKKPPSATGAAGPREVKFLANGEVELPNLPRQMLRWDGTLLLGRDRSLEEIELTVRFEEPAAQVALKINPKTRGFSYVVTEGGAVVATSDAADPQAPGAAQMRMLLMAWGVNPETLDNPEVAAAEQRRLTSLSARHGQIDVGEQRIHAYILTLTVMGGQEIKFYLTEAGELVRVTTFLGYEMLSEVLAPLGSPPRMPEAGSVH